MTLHAPFPWYGGKRRAAAEIWRRLGDVNLYVEPFAGSLAVLLGRPTKPRLEVVNDKDRYLANFWRAIKFAPNEVAKHADWPINECDLTARHTWLAQEGLERLSRLDEDPHDYDAKIAGWWVWGLCSWIGNGWCGGPVYRKLPHLGSGVGVHKKSATDLVAWFQALSERLRHVRIACGDWKRVIGSLVDANGFTGILLDPPYRKDAHTVKYSGGGEDVFDEVAAWAAENGDRDGIRIALCGYEGTWQPPSSWRTFEWLSPGLRVSQKNSTNERVWFSPTCLAGQSALFQ